jgi:NADPH:quinone reductase-like Zn-dependent oxidoreductase
MPSNTAAWQVKAKTKPFEIKSAPYTKPGNNEIVVKNAALGINPIDWMQQEMGYFPIDYPAIIGEDVAGEVVEVGSAAASQGFRQGDRVLGYALSLATKRPSDGAFQNYTVLQTNLVTKIPDKVSFEQASVLPLCLATAAAGLFQKGFLELQLPPPDLKPKPTGQVLLVWGGSSAVGSNGIQLGVAAGYQVFTTASPKNFDYVKKLGASQVFNYNKSSVADDIVAAVRGKTIAGVLDTVNQGGAIQHCYNILSKAQGKKFVVSTLEPPDAPPGVTAKVVLAYTIKDNEVGKAIFNDFLPKALAEGKFVPAPEPWVVGKGLEELQKAVETRKQGVSAKKVVLTL